MFSQVKMKSLNIFSKSADLQSLIFYKNIIIHKLYKSIDLSLFYKGVNESNFLVKK